MEQSKIDMFVMSNSGKFSPQQFSIIQEKLAKENIFARKYFP